MVSPTDFSSSKAACTGETCPRFCRDGDAGKSARRTRNASKKRDSKWISPCFHLEIHSEIHLEISWKSLGNHSIPLDFELVWKGIRRFGPLAAQCHGCATARRCPIPWSLSMATSGSGTETQMKRWYVLISIWDTSYLNITIFIIKYLLNIYYIYYTYYIMLCYVLCLCCVFVFRIEFIVWRLEAAAWGDLQGLRCGGGALHQEPGSLLSGGLLAFGCLFKRNLKEKWKEFQRI